MLAARSEAGRSLSDLLHRGLDLGAFFEAVDDALAVVVPFDSSCWLGLDPGTLLPTSHFTREAGVDDLMNLATNEFLEEDVNKFADLARAQRPVGLMSEATGGVLTISKRHREILAPSGYAEGDELRAVFSEGDAVWGCVALHRRRGTFSTSEADLVADLGTRYIGEGIHRAALMTALRSGGCFDLPGLVLVGPDDAIESMTAAARRMLDEIVDSTNDSERLPFVVASLVTRVRGVAPAGARDVATARVPRRGGGWHVLYGSALDDGTGGRVGVMVYPEAAPELPDSVATAYALTSRERQVSSLVLQGFSTRDIAAKLHVSPYTVQDHLKKVFLKVGVRSRRELVSRIFSAHYVPRLERPMSGT